MSTDSHLPIHIVWSLILSTATRPVDDVPSEEAFLKASLGVCTYAGCSDHECKGEVFLGRIVFGGGTVHDEWHPMCEEAARQLSREKNFKAQRYDWERKEAVCQ